MGGMEEAVRKEKIWGSMERDERDERGFGRGVWGEGSEQRHLVGDVSGNGNARNGDDGESV